MILYTITDEYYPYIHSYIDYSQEQEPNTSYAGLPKFLRESELEVTENFHAG